MSLYGSENFAANGAEELGNSKQYLEMLVVSDIMQGTDEQKIKFCESAFAQTLVEASVMKAETLKKIKASANNRDLNRRIKLAAYQMAKEKNDPMFTKLMKAQKVRKQCIEKIMAKYGRAAEKAAKIGQKEYIKLSRKASSTTEKEDK